MPVYDLGKTISELTVHPDWVAGLGYAGISGYIRTPPYGLHAPCMTVDPGQPNSNTIAKMPTPRDAGLVFPRVQHMPHPRQSRLVRMQQGQMLDNGTAPPGGKA